jgi:carbon-monoxide dehydrogenase medium subunit
VKPAAFAYAQAQSVDHALELLAAHGDDARLLAGGQSLLPVLNMRLAAPAILVDINRIAGLDGIAREGAVLRIGALVRHAALERAPAVAAAAPLIAAAVPHIGHIAIRNRGTIGGSIALADPAAELPACLLALGGTVEIAAPSGRRRVAADDFFTGLYETALGPDEMVAGVTVPAAPPEHRWGFAEIARRHGDYALAGLAAIAKVAAGRLAAPRLAFFGVGAVPIRARGAEAALDAGDLDGAVAALAADLDPFEDAQASAALRRHLAGVVLRRVVGEMRGGTA